MTTPSGPKPNTGRTLEPTSFAVKEFGPGRVYPDGTPDVYGQVPTADKDRSRMGQFPGQSDEAHYRSDTDSSQNALHHTLGSGHSQASPGDHQHDGGTSQKIGPYELNPAFDASQPESPTNWRIRPAWTCANTTASIRTLLHNFLEFRDI